MSRILQRDTVHRISLSVFQGQTIRYFQADRPCQVSLKSFNDILNVENELRCRKVLQSDEQDKAFCQSQGLYTRKMLNKVRQKRLSDAAVLILLCTVNKEPSILYTLRTSHLATHKGEVSFPGGGSDQTDDDVIATALRETHEEIGLELDGIKVWGCGASIPSRDLTKVVTPVIAQCGEIDIDSLTQNKHEVEEVFAVPLYRLCDSNHWSYTRFLIKLTQDGAVKRPSYVMPVFTGAKYRIWGLTATFTYLNLCTLANGLFTFRVPSR